MKNVDELRIRIPAGNAGSEGNTMERKVTIVLGASEKEGRYSNMAVRSLVSKGIPVIAIGNRKGKIGGVEISTRLPEPEGLSVDTITLYLNAVNQRGYYDFILAVAPDRIIFNPGAENPVLEKMAANAGIETLEACTLVMLSTGQY